MKRHRFDGVYIQGNKLYTKNGLNGKTLYTDTVVKIEGVEYRYWHPYRSKPSAMILKGCRNFPFNEKSNVLYLGAGNGTTASFLADIATKGKIFCIEFSKRAYRDLLALAEKRSNIFSILGDANNPDLYDFIVGKDVDVVYQDISQRNQVDIFLRNLEHFRNIRTGVLMIKARSIDVTKKPAEIFKDGRRRMISAGLEVIETVNLAPYVKDHCAMIVKTDQAPQ